MLKKFRFSNHSINSLIGNHTIFKGEFNSRGPLRIDGKFEGRIDSMGKVFIGKSGQAECLILTRNIIIGGKVKGDIFALENVFALKTAEIHGNIYSSSIKMEDGVVFEGECNIFSKQEMRDLIEKQRVGESE